MSAFGKIWCVKVKGRIESVDEEALFVKDGFGLCRIWMEGNSSVPPIYCGIKRNFR